MEQPEIDQPTQGNGHSRRRKEQRIHPIRLIDLVFLFLIVMVGAFYFCGFPNDLLCKEQKNVELQCTNVSISSDVENIRLLNFTVVFENPYGTDRCDIDVQKLPMKVDGNQLVVRKDKVIWQGTHDLSQMKEFPKTIFSFFSRKYPDVQTCRHLYYISCPNLESTIDDYSKKLKINKQNNTMWLNLILAVVALPVILLGSAIGIFIGNCVDAL